MENTQKPSDIYPDPVEQGEESPIQIARQLQQKYESEVGIFFAEIAKLPLKNICKTLIELPSEIFEEAFSRIPQKKWLQPYLISTVPS